MVWEGARGGDGGTRISENIYVLSPKVRKMTRFDGLHRFLELSLGGWISGMNDSGHAVPSAHGTSRVVVVVKISRRLRKKLYSER